MVQLSQLRHLHLMLENQGDDTIMLVIREGCTRAGVKNALSLIIPNIQ